MILQAVIGIVMVVVGLAVGVAFVSLIATGTAGIGTLLVGFTNGVAGKGYKGREERKPKTPVLRPRIAW